MLAATNANLVTLAIDLSIYFNAAHLKFHHIACEMV
jgi:hypothetical protein